MKGILNRRQLCNKKKKPQNTHVYIKEQLFNVNKIYFQFLKKFKKKKILELTQLFILII